MLFATDQALYPVEIKKSATPKREWGTMFRSLETLGGEVGEGAVVCLCPQSLPLSDMTSAVSVGVV